ncbi:eutP/pduV family protein [Escherichia coli]|nr:eutP/pduV family protein [Escherichia coli]
MQIYMLFRQQAGISALRQELEVKTPYRAMNHPVIGSSNQSRFSQHGTHIFGEMLVTGSWSAQRVSNQCG